MTETHTSLAQPDALHLLAHGEVQVEGLIPWSSNATLLVAVRQAGLARYAVYKPQRGEAPLWDFGRGTLGMREVAAYLVCVSLGWGLVPPTVLRQGPLGLGSLQLFVHAREDAHFFTIRDEGLHVQDLMRLAALDALTNNADRKAGHCLLDHEGRLWAIDNALTFHVEPKLRTVIWDFSGMPFPGQVLDDLYLLQERLAERAELDCSLLPLLSADERSALRHRLAQLLRSGRYPEPGPGRAVPWPLL